MIHAIPIDDASDFVRSRYRYAFELTDSTGGEPLLYCRRGGDGSLREGWIRRSELTVPENTTVAREVALGEREPADPDAWRIVVVDLPKDAAMALAEALLTKATGIPLGDARALRQDLDHERARRDVADDALRTIALAAAQPPSILRQS